MPISAPVSSTVDLGLPSIPQVVTEPELFNEFSLIYRALKALQSVLVSNVFWNSENYTPTAVNGTNVAASTPYAQTNYIRSGDFVDVWVVMDIDPTAAGAFDLTLTLPVASTFTSVRQAQGIGICNNGAGMDTAQVYAISATSTVMVAGYVTAITTKIWRINFRYQIL